MSQRITERIDRTADGLLIGIGAVLVVMVLLAVFFRYVLNQSLSWSDELVRYLFVWFTLLGGVVVLREREHIRVEYFVEKVPLPLRRWIDMTMMLMVCGFHVALIVLGGLWVWTTRGSYTSALQWPLNLVFYAALPLTSLVGAWYSVRRIVRGEFTEQDVVEEECLAAEQGGDACRS